ncbi:DUF6406 domain-containing protein [Marinactinospora thermotolerans]|uniref:Uncharacterized protein n=1 Tax=Marinactinospora thermotolerans DSM 45154 TaxID=1122192 RepID=A0A1T4SN22_9ACTN|nr:DUF6406 domain-containing protein [Marinactinospora thermotolerans]SKA29629.1 hypothetical protein SAMN02745673_03744 [Marinactinospora thermotolerans DSM 45154]
MAVLVRARPIARFLASAALASGVVLGAAACGGGDGGESETEATAQSSSPAPLLGENDDRIQLTEGVAYTLDAGSEQPTTLEVVGYEEGEEPAVIISVGEEDGPAKEHTLKLGDTVEAGGSTWRVSEIGMSDSTGSLPGSAALTRVE